jgi:PadR family transcriptional regulator, regulatory protein PadR
MSHCLDTLGMLAYVIHRMPRHRDSAPSRDAALLQGTLDLLVLSIVALEPLHGYGIVRRIQQMSGEALQIRQGSLYPALYRMEQRGLLASDWKTNESGKEAKYYRLTKAGRKALEEETDGWKRLRTAIDMILEGNLPGYEEG